MAELFIPTLHTFAMNNIFTGSWESFRFRAVPNVVMRTPKEVDMEAVKEEMVDVLHFFVSMCLKTGMDADELHRRYLEKNKENFDRQHGRSQKPGYALED